MSRGLSLTGGCAYIGAVVLTAQPTYDPTAEDEVQHFFLGLLGVQDSTLLPLLEANYADVARTVPAFRAYTAGGTMHTILRRPEFYTCQVGGVRFRDRVAALANGEAVDDVKCMDCAQADVYAGE